MKNLDARSLRFRPKGTIFVDEKFSHNFCLWNPWVVTWKFLAKFFDHRTLRFRSRGTIFSNQKFLTPSPTISAYYLALLGSCTVANCSLLGHFSTSSRVGWISKCVISLSFAFTTRLS